MKDWKKIEGFKYYGLPVYELTEGEVYSRYAVAVDIEESDTHYFVSIINQLNDALKEWLLENLYKEDTEVLELYTGVEELYIDVLLHNCAYRSDKAIRAANTFLEIAIEHLGNMDNYILHKLDNNPKNVESYARHLAIKGEIKKTDEMGFPEGDGYMLRIY